MSVHDDETKHQTCMKGLENIEGIDISRGQTTIKYLKVVERVNLFRYHYGMSYSIESEVVVDDGKRVLMVASVKDNDGRVVGQGYAEEIRNAGPVNKTSAIENCETSAIGRALANIGLAGNEYASAFEMENIPNKEEAKASQEKAKVSQEKLEDSKKKVEAIQNKVEKQPAKKQEPHPDDLLMIETTAEILLKTLEGSSLDGLRKNWATNKEMLQSWKDQHPEIYERVDKAYKDKAKELKKAGKESDSE